MSEYLDIINSQNLKFKDHKQLINLLNGLILENRNLYDLLPNKLQDSLGHNIYAIKMFKFEQLDDIMAKTMFEPTQFGKQISKLVEVLKDLLLTHVGLQVQHRKINEQQRKELNAKVRLLPINLGPGPIVPLVPFIPPPPVALGDDTLDPNNFVELFPSKALYNNELNDLFIINAGKTLNDLYTSLDNALDNLIQNINYYNRASPLTKAVLTYNDINQLELDTNTDALLAYSLANVAGGDTLLNAKLNLVRYIKNLLLGIFICFIINSKLQPGNLNRNRLVMVQPLPIVLPLARDEYTRWFNLDTIVNLINPLIGVATQIHQILRLRMGGNNLLTRRNTGLTDAEFNRNVILAGGGIDLINNDITENSYNKYLKYKQKYMELKKYMKLKI